MTGASGKLILLLAPPDHAVGELAAAVTVAANRVGLDRMVVNKVRPTFFGPTTSTPYDLVIESWGSDQALGEFSAIVSAVSVAHTYRVDEIPEWQPPARVGAYDDGLKMFAALTALPNATEQATREAWDGHVALAREIHTRAHTYVRNWVTDRSPDSPPFFGFAALYSATPDDARLYFYAEPVAANQERIRQDVARFLVSAEKIMTTEINPVAQDGEGSDDRKES